MKKNKNKSSSIKEKQGNLREEMKNAGFFDGRFRSKKFVDRKKKANKEACKEKEIDE